MRTLSILFILLFSPVFAWSDTPSFRNEIMPLMTRMGCNSGACHGALAGKGGLRLSLRGYDPEADHFALTRQANTRRVDLQQPARSLLLLKPTMVLDHGGGLKLEVGSKDYQILSTWIARGAPGLIEKERTIQELRVTPASASLEPGKQLAVQVTAHYSDGTTREVTHWSKFSSTEELVASVDDEGMVTGKGHGETAITIWYSNLVAVVRVMSPFPHTLPRDRFASARRNNFIDELVLRKLEALRLPPSPTCGDSEFLRRAFLDCIGVLPTPAETEKFLRDSAKDKREKLIDHLLTRPEFVDYWSYRWSDLLLVSTRKLPQSAVWAFSGFVRQSVAENKPWDRFAREILTARGSTLTHGAANYYVLHRDIADLTEATSITFLGMSVTCARCHNHPLEKWTQDQYWSLANLFSRVTLKNGERVGDVVVQEMSSGDVPHPRRGLAMPPTPLDGVALDANSPRSRREYFAHWLTDPKNPFFARATVNRVWRSYLGRGLVETEDDLRQTNPATNEELLDKLASEFVAHRYDMKWLMRTIMTSATYQWTSQTTPENAADDRFYSHYLVRRLPAEVVLDLYSQITQVPTPFERIKVGTTGGISPTAIYPLGTRALQLPDTLVLSQFLDTFGRPDRNQTCSCERQQDSSVTQALHLNNGKTLNDKLRSDGSLPDRWTNEKLAPDAAIDRLFVLALCRQPTDQERKKLRELFGTPTTATEHREALEDLCWAVLTSKEFLFNR